MKKSKTDTQLSQSIDDKDTQARLRIRTELGTNFMVEAAAGTGKTTSIVNRLVSLIAGGNCKVGQLAAVTFTRKAAAELRERFQAELRRQASVHSSGHSSGPADNRAIRDRMLYASDNCSQAFVGTIHSFCASILRERPIEFGVDPAFRELDEKEELAIREQAWIENINDLIASADPLIDKLEELGIDRQLIKQRFHSFIEHRDVENWPHRGDERSALARDDAEELRALEDIKSWQQKTREYISEMRKLLPMFPASRGTDKLMERYERIVGSSGKDWNRLGNFFNLLDKFNKSHGGTQKYWHNASVAKVETQRWERFRAEVAKPATQYWCRVRYRFVIDFLRRAVSVYKRLKLVNGGLDFNDLLLITARGLKSQPELRRYFQSRYTHLLVDEFQDTDPVQAELILYLTSDDAYQQDWYACRPKAGSLFLVGDPKQSIYRFRRGDIVTYNRVKEIFESSGGEVLALVKNFRSRRELIEWNNQIFQRKFLAQSNPYKPAAEDMIPADWNLKTLGLQGSQPR